MKSLLLSALVLFTWAAESTLLNHANAAPDGDGRTVSVPDLIGKNRTDVHKQLDQPDFKGKIFGIGTGDTLQKCISEWGKPSKITPTRSEYAVLSWEHKGHHLEVEVWKKDGMDRTFGAYKKETVKRIKIAGKSFETYPQGLVFHYDLAGKVTRVAATSLASNTHFAGKIFGIGLGDTRKKCIAQWGKPRKTTPTRFEYAVLSWEHKGHHLEVEVWKKDGNDKTFGTYKKDTVKRIEVAPAEGK